MRKRLGQYFLKDESTLKKIVDALDIKDSDTVIEIGPGHGELTNYILRKSPKKLIAIEKDKKLAQQVKCLPANNFEVIEGDVLKLLPDVSDRLQIPRYKLVGNIPYYITGYLLRTLGELEHKPSLIVLTVQKEVAERICAKPPKMNLLAASVQFWAKPEIVDYISKKDFHPMPEVDGAIIKLNINTSDVLRISDVQKLNYYKCIKIIFKQPRKTILNNLADGFAIPKGEISIKLTGAGIIPESRPQDLTIQDLTRLTNVFCDKK